MTPKELLNEVKNRFIVLYHNDDSDLLRLLKQALGKYQEKAGEVAEVSSNSSFLSIPPHYLCTVCAADAAGRRMTCKKQSVETVPASEIAPAITEEKFVFSVNNRKFEAPYTLYYFQNLRDWDMDEELPHDCVALIGDYLEALIALYNVERQKEVYLATGISSGSELPSQSELKQRLSDIEIQMEDNKAIIMPQSSF